MPYVNLKIPPGFFPDRTAADGLHWESGDKVRFWEGKPQKISGWTKYVAATLSGTCRSMMDWLSLSSIRYVVFGSHTHLQILDGTTLTDITPIRESGTLGTDPFAVEDGSTTVTVTDASHGLSVGDRVAFSGATAGGGITINGAYTVVTVPTGGTYTITHSAAATSTDSTTGGASVAYTYYLPIGTDRVDFGGGWNADSWGSDGWGETETSNAYSIPPRTWSFSLWGEDLIACPRGLNIYVWDTSVGVGTPAAKITNSPLATFAFVSPLDRHLIALGSDEGGGTIDPMVVQWSDQEDYTTWTPAATNTAGSFRLTEGSQIISGLNSRGGTYVWTDTSLYFMQFLGPPFTFGFELLSRRCGLMAAYARTEAASRIWWLSRDAHNFYVFDGTVKILPCPILKSIQEDINLEQQDRAFCVTMARYNEIWWFYPSAASEECDSYIIYNYLENTWYNGTMDRLTAIDSGLFNSPLMVGLSGTIYQHDVGVDDDGTAMETTLSSGDIEVLEGNRLALVDKVALDGDFTGNLNITFEHAKHLDSTESTKGPYTYAPGDGALSVRVKGRKLKITLGNEELGSDWRVENIKLNTKVAGGR